MNANSATWLDYDRDGRLDLFLAGYWPDDVNLWKLETTRIMPESFEYANNGGRKYLLHNRGDGTFEDVTAALGITQPALDAGGGRRRSAAAPAIPDLFLANDYGVSELFANRERQSASWTWPQTTGVGRTPKSGMNASFGDVFNDGRLAIYKTNISEPGVLVQGNDLWVPEDAGRRCRTLREPGVEPGRRSRRLELGRAVRRSEQRRHAGSVSGQRLHLGRRAQQLLVRLRGDCRRAQQIIGDAANWPAMKGRSLSGYQRKRVWINDGARPLHRCGAGRRRHATPTTAARWRWPISATAACSTSSSPTSAGRC